LPSKKLTHPSTAILATPSFSVWDRPMGHRPVTASLSRHGCQGALRFAEKFLPPSWKQTKESAGEIIGAFGSSLSAWRRPENLGTLLTDISGGRISNFGSFDYTSTLPPCMASCWADSLRPHRFASRGAQNGVGTTAESKCQDLERFFWPPDPCANTHM